MLNSNKQPVLLPKIFRHAVYKMQFGPSSNDNKKKYLYVCAEGQLVAYDLVKPLESNYIILQKKIANNYTCFFFVLDPIAIEHKENIWVFAWNSNLTQLIVGTHMGTLTLYSKDLTLISNLYVQKKRITNLLWHPDVEDDKDGDSEIKYNNWLALSTTTGTSVYVYEIIYSELGKLINFNTFTTYVFHFYMYLFCVVKNYRNASSIILYTCPTKFHALADNFHIFSSI